MKTIKLKLFTFAELCEKAQQRVINNYLGANNDHDFLYYDARETIKAFCHHFDLKTSSRSFFEPVIDLHDDILSLTGLRLRTYILNNYGHVFYKNKFLKHGEKTQEPKKFHRMRRTKTIQHGQNKDLFYSVYYSNIQKVSNSCNLTGVCYDEDILKPFYDFIDKPCKYTNLEDLIKEGFSNLEMVINSEVEYFNSEKYAIEQLTVSGTVYTENGQEFTQF